MSRLEWPANLDPSARAARDASLLANTGTNSAFAKMVTARIARHKERWAKSPFSATNKDAGIVYSRGAAWIWIR